MFENITAHVIGSIRLPVVEKLTIRTAQNDYFAGTASALGQMLGTLDDLVIVAPPGTGKTSALFQLAEASTSAANGTPLVVSLSDWSTGGLTLIEAILRRPAFSGFTEADLRAVAGQPGVVFMFDSWNELGSDARCRARTEIQNLRAELPAATFIATTRPEISDVPIDGQMLTVLELSEQQQMDIAREIKGEQGVRLVDEFNASGAIRAHPHNRPRVSRRHPRRDRAPRSAFGTTIAMKPDRRLGIAMSAIRPLSGPLGMTKLVAALPAIQLQGEIQVEISRARRALWGQTKRREAGQDG